MKKIKLAQGLTEQGIEVGNHYDKYASKNPIARKMVQGFEQNLQALVNRCQPARIHEVGCGEGYWLTKWGCDDIECKGSDFSSQVIDLAEQNIKNAKLNNITLEQKSIYDLDESTDSAELIVCCEVLEHIEAPQAGLEALQKVTKQHIILSVPREPIWCILNLARFKYIRRLGNTPGHIQHWSKAEFIKLVSNYFDIIEVRSPLPWTMLLCKKRN